MNLEQTVRNNYHNLTKYLIDHNLTITTMESATSGQIASLITDTDGSSAVLKGALVTYSNEAKIKQGVDPKIIERHTVYSNETSRAMARAVLKTYPSDIAISVTGTTGNVDEANPKNSVPGQVYFTIIVGEKEQDYFVELPELKTRLEYKLAVANEVYEKLMKLI